MAREEISIRTEDGDCRAWVFTPNDGGGAWPAVIFYMDGMGIRPPLLDMGERLARAGFVVLAPDMFYRAGPYAPRDPKVALAGGEPPRTPPLMSFTDNARGAQDTAAFLAYLDSRKDVAGDKVGTTGYCMGGGISLTVAATYPDRIAAAASFHGGNLASDSPLSPHLLAGKMKARVYVAAADNDPYYPPAMAARLVEALSEAHLDFRHDLYPGAAHGWTQTDFPIYDAPAAERHWRELVALFKATLN